MSIRTIYITEYDAQRLQALINNPSALEHRAPECLKELREELSRAEIVAPEDIPPDVVTMNSTVQIVDVSTKEKETYTLVFPSDADVGEGRISVLAPIGIAMLGCRTGDTFSWTVPGGVRRLRVKGVLYQPEALGDYQV